MTYRSPLISWRPCHILDRCRVPRTQDDQYVIVHLLIVIMITYVCMCVCLCNILFSHLRRYTTKRNSFIITKVFKKFGPWLIYSNKHSWQSIHLITIALQLLSDSTDYTWTLPCVMCSRSGNSRRTAFALYWLSSKCICEPVSAAR